MSASYTELMEKFRLLDDEELLRRSQMDTLTEMAQSVARAEIERRGLKPDIAGRPPVDLASLGRGKLMVVAKCFVPTEAFLLKSCLESNGVPAIVADAHLIQANQFLTTAVGGVRVLVPESHFEQGKKIFEEFEAGVFQLDDDFDVGQEVK